MSLPDIEYYEKRKTSWFSMSDRMSASECGERLAEILAGDSWAVTVNGAVVFNKYEYKSVRDKIIDSLIRDKLISAPFTLLNDVIRKTMHSRINIYLGGDIPWFVVCRYNHESDICIFEYLKSAKYMNHEKRILGFQDS